MTRYARIWLYVLIAVCLVSLALSLFWFVAPPPAPSQSASVLAQYILREQGGRIAVYQNGAQTPLQVYDIYTHLLPPHDVERLRQGIFAENEAQLDALLEDFGL